jgi:hypothetical protein
MGETCKKVLELLCVIAVGVVAIVFANPADLLPHW